MTPTGFILDTDLDTDCDDVGAIAMAHARHRHGTLRLQAVICSAPVPACGPCAVLLNRWPGELVVSPAGDDIQTGATLSGACPPGNPFRQAYEIHRGGPGRSRSSWDQEAVLYASGAGNGLFGEIADKGLDYDASTGDHAWSDQVTAAPRRHVLPIPGPEPMAGLIEPLMVEGARGPA